MGAPRLGRSCPVIVTPVFPRSAGQTASSDVSEDDDRLHAAHRPATVLFAVGEGGWPNRKLATRSRTPELATPTAISIISPLIRPYSVREKVVSRVDQMTIAGIKHARKAP